MQTTAPSTGAPPAKGHPFPAYMLPRLPAWDPIWSTPVGRWIYRQSGGGDNLRVTPPGTWDRLHKKQYYADTHDRPMDDASYKKLVGPSDPYLALDSMGLPPEVTTAYKAAPTRKPGDVTEKDWAEKQYHAGTITGPSSLLESGNIGSRRLAGAVTNILGDAQDREMRARALGNISNVALWSLLAGALYGVGRNWKKLLVEKNLEQEDPGAVKAAALPVAQTPWDAKILLYPRDMSLFLPAAGIAAGVGGYQLVDWLTDKARKKALENKRRAAMTEFQQLFAQGIGQNKVARLVDEAAELNDKGQLEKAAIFDALAELSPGWQAAIYTTPLALGLMSYLAARDMGLKESKKERAAAMQAIRASQLARPTQIQFVPSSRAGGMEQQGFMSNRYNVPILLPQHIASRPVPPDEMDLTKLSSKQADWAAPTNAPLGTGKGVGAPDPGAWKPPAAPKPQLPAATPATASQGPSSPAEASARAVQPGFRFVNPLEGFGSDLLNNWGSKAIETMGPKLLKNPALRDAAMTSLSEWGQTPEGGKAMRGVIKNVYPQFDRAMQTLQQVQTGQPNGIMQSLAGMLMGNPNMKGWGGWGNLLGAMVPGQHPWLANLWNMIPGAASGALGSVANLFAPFKDAVGATK